MCVCVTTALGSLLGESPLGCGCIPALRLMSLFHTISRFPINPSGEPVSPRPEGSCGDTRGLCGLAMPGAWGPWGNGLGLLEPPGLNPRRARLGRSRVGPSRSAARARAPHRALPTIWVPQKPQLGVPGVSGSATPLSPSHASCVRETLFSLKTSGFV